MQLKMKLNMNKTLAMTSRRNQHQEWNGLQPPLHKKPSGNRPKPVFDKPLHSGGRSYLLQWVQRGLACLQAHQWQDREDHQSGSWRPWQCQRSLGKGVAGNWERSSRHRLTISVIIDIWVFETSHFELVLRPSAEWWISVCSMNVVITQKYEYSNVFRWSFRWSASSVCVFWLVVSTCTC